MKLTTEQMVAILPHLQRAVQAQIDRWDAEHEIERALGREFSSMSSGIEHLAVCADKGTDVKTYNVQNYIDSCEEN